MSTPFEIFSNYNLTLNKKLSPLYDFTIQKHLRQGFYEKNDEICDKKAVPNGTA